MKTPAPSAGWAPVLGLVVFCIGGAQAAHAQNGSLVGRLLADDGHPVPGASVLLRPAGAGRSPRYATSDESGAFRFGFVPVGTYQLAAYRIGFRSTVVDPVIIREGAPQALTIRMAQVAFGLDSVVVSAPEARIDRNETEFGRRLGPRELAELPLPRPDRAGPRA